MSIQRHHFLLFSRFYSVIRSIFQIYSHTENNILHCALFCSKAGFISRRICKKLNVPDLYSILTLRSWINNRLAFCRLVFMRRTRVLTADTGRQLQSTRTLAPAFLHHFFYLCYKVLFSFLRCESYFTVIENFFQYSIIEF